MAILHSYTHVATNMRRLPAYQNREILAGNPMSFLLLVLLVVVLLLVLLLLLLLLLPRALRLR